ncbi:MAG: hypothetical protein FWE55_00195 [Synergistaceae bacterium]|nr:hypothetical protein [Synergistaceae bacterium]
MQSAVDLFDFKGKPDTAALLFVIPGGTLACVLEYVLDGAGVVSRFTLDQAKLNKENSRRSG